MGHLSKVQRHLGEKGPSVGPWRGSCKESRAFPGWIQGWILVEGMWLAGEDGIAHFSSAFLYNTLQESHIRLGTSPCREEDKQAGG